jgi:peptide/nickel transport system substrate-binding protein
MACSGPGAGQTGGNQGAGGEQRNGGTLRIATLGSLPTILHPYPQAEHYSDQLVNEGAVMGAGLINLDDNTLEFGADQNYVMATGLPTISADGRTFTFTLRSDIKWSDGKPITSADFLYAWQNASKEENNWVGFDDVDHFESFATPDARTIVVTLKDRFARFVAMSYAAGIGPVPRQVWEGKPWYDPQANPEITKPTVVNGPWMPKDFSTEHHTYQRNPNWWGKQPNIDQIDFVSASPDTTLELLRTGQVEWAMNFPPSQFQTAKSLANANVFNWTSASGLYRVLLFNLQRPQLRDKRVREALSRAINRADFVQFEENLAQPQLGLLPASNTKWLNENVEHYDFDVNRAKQLLQDAGYRLDGNGALRDGSGTQLNLEIIYPTTSQPRQRGATYIQQQWKQLGVDVSVTGLEANAFFAKYGRQKDFDVAMGSYGGGTPDPIVLESQVKTDGQQNSDGYSNPRVDQLLLQGIVEQDDTRRKAIYDELQKIVTDDLPFFNLITVQSITAIDKKVAGASPSKGDNMLTANNMQILDWSIKQ